MQEHLLVFARIRGIDNVQEKAWVQHTAELVMLDNDAFLTPAGSLSGGMKRRLSIGMAMMGDPRIIMLDEPSTGIDPESRQCVWNIVDAIKRRERQSIVVTTHSMTEADALCSRIGILMDGNFQCIGTQNHLKKRFGDGYTLTLTLQMKTKDHVQQEWFGLEEENVKKIEDAGLKVLEREIESRLKCSLRKKGAQSNFSDRLAQPQIPRTRSLKTVQNGIGTWKLHVSYRLYAETLAVERFFEEIEQMQVLDEVNVVEWGLNPSSLEDVFLNIVSKHGG